MALAPSSPSIPVCRERVVSVQRQSDPFTCLFANQTKLLLSRSLAPYVGIGDEITFPIPSADAAGAEIYITKNGSSRTNRSVYQVRIGYISQPKQDKRNQHFVSADVHRGSLGINKIFLPCEVLREYFYHPDRVAAPCPRGTRQSTRGCPFPEYASQNSAPYGPRRDTPSSPCWGRAKALALLSLRTGRLASLSANLEQPPASRTPRRLHWLSERGISTVVLKSTNE